MNLFEPALVRRIFDLMALRGMSQPFSSSRIESIALIPNGFHSNFGSCLEQFCLEDVVLYLDRVVNSPQSLTKLTCSASIFAT
jgi:alpha-D-ribose 1-methylphosphonate 5-triphosphate synthase subunit PhnH